MTEQMKKCTNCTRGPQLLDQFIGARGYPVSTCAKCREKGKKGDTRPERQEYHTELQKARGAGYSKKSAEKMKTDPPPPEHNLEQTCEWIQTDKAKERISKWKKLNIHDRISSSKRQAIAKGLEWELTDEEAEKMLTSPCVYCKHIDLEVRLNGIDRLNQQGNYTTENTVPCCWTCNFMKGVMDPRTFIERCTVVSKCTHEFSADIPRQELDLYLNRKKTTQSPLSQPTQVKSLETHTTECPSRDQPCQLEMNVELEDR
jgi:hypothetical protein